MTKLNEDQQKEIAAGKALESVESNMILGLGSGSTAEKFIHLLGKKFKAGDLENIKVVSSSKDSEAIAHEYKIPVLNPEAVEKIDLNVDGTDETTISEGFSVKGGGNALHREKMIALKSAKNIFIAQNIKAVESLGGFGLPIEVGQFDVKSTIKRIENIFENSENFKYLEKTKINLKIKDKNPVVTDNGNFMLHLDFMGKKLKNPQELLEAIKKIEGVFSVGFFLNILDTLIIGNENGEILEYNFKRV